MTDLGKQYFEIEIDDEFRKSLFKPDLKKLNNSNCQNARYERNNYKQTSE